MTQLTKSERTANHRAFGSNDRIIAEAERNLRLLADLVAERPGLSVKDAGQMLDQDPRCSWRNAGRSIEQARTRGALPAIGLTSYRVTEYRDRGTYLLPAWMRTGTLVNVSDDGVRLASCVRIAQGPTREELGFVVWVETEAGMVRFDVRCLRQVV